MPSVDVLIPAAGSAEFFREALASLQGQTFKDFRIVICDNACGHDRYRDEARAFEALNIDYLKFNERLPINLNWQRCLNQCQSDFFAFLHDDDLWAPAFLSDALQEMEEGVGMVAVPFQRFLHGEDPWGEPENDAPLWNRFRDGSALVKNVMMALSPMIHLSSCFFRRLPIGIDSLLTWNCDQDFAQAYARLFEVRVGSGFNARIREHQWSETSGFRTASATRQTLELLKRNLVVITRRFGAVGVDAIFDELTNLTAGATFRFWQAIHQMPVEVELFPYRSRLSHDQSMRKTLGSYGTTGKLARYLPGKLWFPLVGGMDLIYAQRLSRGRS